MTRFLHTPRLPKSPVTTVLASGEYPWLKKALAKHDIQAVTTKKDVRLPEPVVYHPDLQVCPFPDKQMFVLKGNSLSMDLQDLGFTVLETHAAPGNNYPEDVLCGGCLFGAYLIGNPKGMDKYLQQTALNQGYTLIPVKQGYTACSVAFVNEQSAITFDRGLEQALRSCGIQVLLIQPGYIVLPGYDTGFIGGCCGKIAEDKLVFCGQLSNHPDGDLIRSFLKEQNVSAVELIDGPLIDIGGIVPLLEYGF